MYNCNFELVGEIMLIMCVYLGIFFDDVYVGVEQVFV